MVPFHVLQSYNRDLSLLKDYRSSSVPGVSGLCVGGQGSPSAMLLLEQPWRGMSGPNNKQFSEMRIWTPSCLWFSAVGLTQ